MIRKQYYMKTECYKILSVSKESFQAVYNKLFSHTGKTLGSVNRVCFKDLEKVEEYLNSGYTSTEGHGL